MMLTSYCHCGVVHCDNKYAEETRKLATHTITCHVWRNEHPLGKLVVLEIFEEHGRILDLGSSFWSGYHRVEHDLRAASH